MKRRAWPWSVAAGLIVAALLSLHVLAKHDGDISAIYYVDRTYHDSWSFETAYPQGRIAISERAHDALFFLALANDPTLRDLDPRPPRYFYRARRIGYAWAGYLLGFGHPEAILYALPIVGLLAVALGTGVLARFALSAGRHPAWSLLYPASLGAAVCLLRPTADLFATSLLLVGLALWQRSRWGATGVFTFAALSRETTLILPFALALERMRAGRLREALPLLLCPAAMLAWWAYVRSGGPDTYMGAIAFGLPFEGILEELKAAKSPLTALGMAGAALGIPIAFALRPDRWDGLRLAAFGFALVAALSSAEVWEDVFAYGRVHMTVPTLLLATYLRGGTRLDVLPAVFSAIAGTLLWVHALR